MANSAWGTGLCKISASEPTSPAANARYRRRPYEQRNENEIRSQMRLHRIVGNAVSEKRARGQCEQHRPTRRPACPQ